jgi:hypothetical protein
LRTEPLSLKLYTGHISVLDSELAGCEMFWVMVQLIHSLSSFSIRHLYLCLLVRRQLYSENISLWDGWPRVRP